MKLQDYPLWKYCLVDSHCHLLKIYEYDTDITNQLLLYKQRCILDIGIEPDDWDLRIKLFSHIPNVFFSIGKHPSTYKSEEINKAQTAILKYAHKAHAIGESGLDWFHMYADKNTQYDFLEMQLDIAQKLHKPIIIHTRSSSDLNQNAIDDFIHIVNKTNYNAGGVMHCFTGSYEQAKKCMDLGFYISFSAVISYSSAKELQNLVPKIPSSYLLAETDAPYLLHRKAHNYHTKQSKGQKKRRYNHPSYLPFLYETLAVLRKSKPTDIADVVYKNLHTMLGV